MPEVSANDLATLQASKALLDSIYADPDHGMAVKKAVAKVRPDIPIPELRAEQMFQPFAEQINGIAASVAELAKQREDDKAAAVAAVEQDKLARAMAVARDKFRLTEEGTEGMLNLMREKGIMDPHDAAELYVARQPKPKIAGRSSGAYGQSTYADITGQSGDQAKQDLLLSNPDKFLVQEVEEMLAEFERTGEMAE